MRIKSLFHKYLENACTPQELSELFSLLQQEEAAGTLDGEMRAVWNSLKANTQPAEVNWNAMLHRIQQQPGKTFRLRKLALWTAGAAAAAVLAVVGVQQLRRQHPDAVQTAVQNAPALAEVRAGKDKQFVYLPDGSVVILNQGSLLRYDSRLGQSGQTTREVFLEGEAFFDVKQDAARPFTVRSGELSTLVLGTSFNIKAYPGDKHIQVTVKEGKVQVSGKEKSPLGTLTADQQIVFDRQAEKFSRAKVDAATATAWTPAELFFDDKTLAELAVFLETKYNCNVHFQDNVIAAQRISITIEEKDTLEEILAVIEQITGRGYTINQKSITIK